MIEIGSSVSVVKSKKSQFLMYQIHSNSTFAKLAFFKLLVFVYFFDNSIDDIEDGSTIRRGKPAAHCVFGAPLSINSANFVYFLALQKVLELQHPEAVTIFTGK